MARKLNNKPAIEIHQALHGYSDGHRQLAISAKLEALDSKLLLTFSDISGPGAKPESDGYLTGYPLSRSGFFALSRTWLALEMPRPGCVWTHTLLVNFADLAVIESLEELYGYFRYPKSPNELERYSTPLELVITECASRPVKIGEPERRIVQELYGSPDKRVLVERATASSDELVLALWSQQWPRLRRSFSFCSLCTRDRSSSGINFDLQLMARNFRSGTIQGSNPREAGEHHPREAGEHHSRQEIWLLRTLRDLERPNEKGLRSFLKLVGSDVEGGREAFQPLCTLFARLEQGNGKPSMLRPALAALKEPILTNARTAQAVVANVLAANIEHVDDVELSFLWKNIEYVDKELVSKQGSSVVRALWRRTPEGFNKGSWSNATQRSLIDRAVETTELSELLIHVIGVPELEEIALLSRPKITQEAQFWKNATELARAVEFAASTVDKDKALVAMITAEREDLAQLAISNMGEKEVLLVIASLSASNRNIVGVREWTVEATRNTAGITEILRKEKKLELAFLSMVAGCVSEDAILSQDEEDPWLIALRNAGAVDGGKALDLHLAVFLLCRAFRRASRSPGGLVRAGFESVDKAMAERRLPEELWRKLERHLPVSIFWFGWSRTHRVRSAVANLFVEGGLAPEEFVQITSEPDIFGDLVRQLSWSRSGREYLEEVMRYARVEEKRLKKKGKGRNKSRMRKTIRKALE